MNTRTKGSGRLAVSESDSVQLALYLAKNIDPMALAAGLMTLAEIIIGMRDGTRNAPPAEVTLGEVVIAAVKGALEDKLASH